tara:strand:+ start:389 stop:514 length:126 start_codon:yes stop_codon:yes gene_type:complete
VYLKGHANIGALHWQGPKRKGIVESKIGFSTIPDQIQTTVL